jgi:hypothetical protein
MVKRLEQVAALVVAAGLAIVSYWLFFSWMGQDRRPTRRAALPVSEAVNFAHSRPYTQSLNPVECAVRQLHHLMNFFLQKDHLSALCWVDMAALAVYVMNRLPHPQSLERAQQVHSAY